MRTLGLALTVLRPMAFMELMTDKLFYPPVSTWHVMPKLLGASTAVPWLAVDDLAAVAVLAFAERARFVGRDLPLAADLRSIDECREIYRRIFGHRPRRIPMPRLDVQPRRRQRPDDDVALVGRGTTKAETDTLRAIYPNAMTCTTGCSASERHRQRQPELQATWGLERQRSLRSASASPPRRGFGC